MVHVLAGAWFISATGQVCLPPQPDWRGYGIHWPNQTGRMFCYSTITVPAIAGGRIKRGKR